MMKIKLSALEELRQEKARLIHECAVEKQKVLHNLDYAKKNFGTLFLNSALTSTKSSVADLFSGSSAKVSKKSQGFGDLLLSFTPVLWNVAQPMLIGLAIKKIKSLVTKRSKR
ncbi:MAG: hypothetical protein RL662_1076 [Bacteroidota bacterium]